MHTTFPIRKSSNPRNIARRILEALRNGETVSCTAYPRGADDVLNAIHTLVLAELPEVQWSHLYHRGERLWVWSVGEPEGVAYFPRQEPETVLASFAQRELG